MQVAYLKMHGTGNEILVVDQRNDDIAPPTLDMLRVLGDEKSGPGFDQMMWVTSARNPDNAAAYRVFNSDGSEVEQCGNGVRCVVRMLAGTPGEAATLTLESPAGLIEARVSEDGQVSVSMGSPEFEPVRIPFIAERRAVRYELDVNGRNYDTMAVSMGNPHCVLQVADVNVAPVAQLGTAIEKHDRYPERTNVGFMRIVDRENVDLRVHERGIGETRACGTGACAAVVCGQQLELLDERVNVRLPGGQVVVSWRGGAAPVWLTGNAELISKGSMDL